MTEPIVLARQAVQTEQQDVDAALVALVNFEVLTEDDQNFAAEMLRDVKAKFNLLEEKRTSITKPMNAALRAVNALFKPPQEALEKCEKILKQKIAGYLQAKEDANRELLLAAAEAETLEEASLALATVEVVQAPTGVSVRQVWKFEIINEGLVPVEYWSVDASKIKAAMGAGEPEPIPGVRFFQEPIVTSRRV